MVHAGEVLYLFALEDCVGDTGKFLPQNTKHCKSSEFMLKAEFTMNFWVRTPLPTPLDVSWGAKYVTLISSISLSKEAWAICFSGMVLLSTKRCCNTLSSRTTRVE